MKKSAVLFLTVVLFSFVFYFFDAGLTVFGSGLLNYIFLAVCFSLIFLFFRFWNYKFLVFEISEFGLSKPYITLFSLFYGLISVLFVFLLSYIVKGAWLPNPSSVFGYVKIVYKVLFTTLITEYLVNGIIFSSARKLLNNVFAVILVVALYTFTVFDFSSPVKEMLSLLIETVVFRIVLCLIVLYVGNIWGAVFISFCIKCFYSLFFYESEISQLFFDCIRYCLYLSLLAVFIILLIKKRNDETLYW